MIGVFFLSEYYIFVTVFVCTERKKAADIIRFCLFYANFFKCNSFHAGCLLCQPINNFDFEICTMFAFMFIMLSFLRFFFLWQVNLTIFALTAETKYFAYWNLFAYIVFLLWTCWKTLNFLWNVGWSAIISIAV